MTPEQEALAIAAREALAEQEALVIAARIDSYMNPKGWGGKYLAWHKAGWNHATTLAEAHAKWVAAGGDPGRGPAFSGRGDGIFWRVDWSDGPWRVFIRVRDNGFERWSHWPPGKWAPLNDGQTSLPDLSQAMRLAEAADGGAR